MGTRHHETPCRRPRYPEARLLAYFAGLRTLGLQKQKAYFRGCPVVPSPTGAPLRARARRIDVGRRGISGGAGISKLSPAALAPFFPSLTPREKPILGLAQCRAACVFSTAYLRRGARARTTAICSFRHSAFTTTTIRLWFPSKELGGTKSHFLHFLVLLLFIANGQLLRSHTRFPVRCLLYCGTR